MTDQAHHDGNGATHRSGGDTTPPPWTLRPLPAALTPLTALPDWVLWKWEEKNGKWQLTPAWLSHNMQKGEETVIANGVVYAYGSGEDTNQRTPDVAYNQTATPQDNGGQSAQRIAGSTHVTLYALDGQTGKELWSSGDQITSFNHFAGISIANGRIYVPTFSGDVYCFGIARKQ